MKKSQHLTGSDHPFQSLIQKIERSFLGIRVS
jgi:hypothetical protein